MLSNSTLKKLTQTSEEALPPVHVPLTLDNDCYVLTQQDIRKIEDSRLLSLSKLMQNGDLQPLNSMAFENLAHILKLRLILDNQSSQNRQNLIELIGLLNGKSNDCPDGQQSWSQPLSQCNAYPQPMETASCTCPNMRQVASVEQQLNWDTFKNTSAPFPMTYSQGTSSTEICAKYLNEKKQQNIQTCCSCCCCLSCRRKTNTKTVAFSKATYTQDSVSDCEPTNPIEPIETPSLGAREQLKQKKMSNDCSFIS